MDVNELQRIYQLKTTGLASVLSDINAITDAFRKSSEAAGALAGNKGAFDAGQLATVNKQLEQMVGIQEELLACIKATNVESTKSTATLNNIAGSSTNAAEGMEDLANAAKSLGTNLTGASAGLLKVQSTLNAGNIEDYDEAINVLIPRLIAAKNALQGAREAVAASAKAFNEGRIDVEDYNITQTAYANTIIYGNQQVKELTSAISTLNTRYKEGIGGLEEFVNLTAEATLANKQNAESIVLQAKAEDEAIAKAIQLGVTRKNVANEVNSGVTEGLGGAGYLADRKLGQQELRTEVEMLRNKSIILNEEASYYQRLVAQVNTLKMSMRLLNEEELANVSIGGIMLERTQQLDAKLKEFDKNMGNNQRNVGNYASALLNVNNLTQMFTRQLVRGVGSLIIWGVLFDAITKVGTAIEAAIPGTEEYAKEQEKLAQANEALVSSFEVLYTELLKLHEAQTTFYSDLDEGVEAAKRKEAAVRALGVVNGKSATAEMEQSKAKQAVLQEELKLLNDKSTILTSSFDILKSGQRTSEEYIGKPNIQALLKYGNPESNKNVQYELYNQLAKAVQNANLPIEQETKFIAALNKGYSEGANVLSIYKKNILEVGVALKKTNQDIVTNKAQQRNIDVEQESKRAALVYAKNVELKNQLTDLWESYREVSEKRNIASVDKIVGDYEAKFKLSVNKLKQATVEYAKTVLSDFDFESDKNKDGSTNYNAIYDKLPKSITDETNKQIYVQSLIKKKGEKDDTAEFIKQQFLQNLQFKATDAQNASGDASFSADYGAANYGKMAEAIDAETQAKKRAIDVRFENEKNARIQNDTDLLEIQKGWEAEYFKTDQDAYKKRLQLGIDYFKKLYEVTEAGSQHILSQIDLKTASDIHAIMAGRGTADIKERRIDKITNRGIISAAQEQIVNARQDLEEIGGLNDVYASSKINEQTATSPDKVAEAQKATAAIVIEQDKRKKTISDAQATIDKAKEDDKKKNKEYLKAAADGGLQIAQTLADSYMALLEKQDAYRAEMAKRSLAYNQRVMASEVQSSNQQVAQQRAVYLASQQIDKEKAQADKKRAEQQIIINGVIAIAKAWADSGNPILAGIETGVIVAQMAIEESMLAKAPAYASGTRGSHPGGVAWIGDGYEPELLKIGNSLAISPSVPTLANLPAGTEVTPFSKISTISGDMGASLKAPRFNVSASNNSYSGSGGPIDVQAHEDAIQGLYSIVGQMGKHLSNLNINYSPKKAQKAAVQASYKTRSV